MSVTFDSNILVYAADSKAGTRHSVAAQFLRRATTADCVLTLQSLGEFFHVSTRKGHLPLDRAQSHVDTWRAVFPIMLAERQTLSMAIDAVRRDGLSFWDAMLWATVADTCDTIFTEDFQDGRRLGGVRFVNPFLPANRAVVDALLPPDQSDT